MGKEEDNTGSGSLEEDDAILIPSIGENGQKIYVIGVVGVRTSIVKYNNRIQS